LHFLAILALILAYPLSAAETSTFVYQIGGTIPVADQYSVTSQTSSQIRDMQVRTSGQSWLNPSLSSPHTPSILTISVNPIGLPIGNYAGVVEVYAPNSTNTLVVNVLLVVTAAVPPLSASPANLTFNAVQGSNPPSAQSLVIGATLPPGSMITSDSTAPAWLNVGWISVGNSPMNIQIAINPSFTNLAAGQYSTSLLFEAPFTAQKVTVLITLNVSTPPPVIKTSITSLQFHHVLGSSTPPTQGVQVTSSNASALAATVTLGASWLTANSLAGTTPFTMSIGINPSGLTVGTHTNNVTIATSPVGLPPSSQVISVTLTIVADTRPEITSVANAASFKTTISPGAWVSIIGRNFSPTTQQAVAVPLPLMLSGVGARLSGIGGVYNLPITFASPTQLNVFVPHEVNPTIFGSSGATITVTTPNGTATSPVTCDVIAPALFFYGANNVAAAVFTDGTIVGTIPGTRRAVAGDIISLYGTGFGQTNPISSNINGPVTARPLAANVNVSIGGIPAEVMWAGMVGMGLYQFNVVVPPLPSGNHPTAAQVSGVISPIVLIPVQ